MAFSDYSVTNSGNSTISGINVGENCPPGNLNNGIRQVAADIRAAINPAMDPVLGATDLTSARTAFGVLPISGGMLTGPIRQNNAGVHPNWANPAMTGGRMYLTAASASDPTSQPGDIWFKY